jgi:Plasmid pRiA4b ORF-3-like protein
MSPSFQPLVEPGSREKKATSAAGGFRPMSEVVRNRRACISVASRRPARSRITTACAISALVSTPTPLPSTTTARLKKRRQPRGTHSVKNSPERQMERRKLCRIVHSTTLAHWPEILHSRRRLLVASDTSIAELHEVLQSAFDWSGERLHRCLIHGQKEVVATPQVRGVS